MNVRHLHRFPDFWLSRHLPSQSGDDLEVDPNHLLAPAAMYMPSLLLADLVSGNPLSAGPVLPSLDTTLYGPAMSFPGTSGGAGYIAGTGPFLGGLSAWSVCTLVRSTASPNAGGSALYCERATSGNDILKVIVSSSSSGAAVYRNDAGTLINQNFGPVSVTDGRIYLVSATFDNSNVISYADSTVETSSGWGGANNNFTDANIRRTIGYDVADGTASFNGHILAVYLYKRALSPSEIAHLQNRPFSMLRPRARRIYSVPSVNPSATGVAASGSAGILRIPSAILFAGQEDLSFQGINAPINTSSGNPIVINTTSSSGQFRSAYSRCSINIQSGVYNSVALNTFLIRTGIAFSASSSFWTSGRMWAAAGSNPNSGFPLMRWVDANGVVRLLIQTASQSGSVLGVYKVNAAGTQTQLGVNTASGVSASPATPDKIDVFINYSGGPFILYVNGTQVFYYDNDLTTDGNTSLAYVDFGMAVGSAFAFTASNHWSECIVATTDTRQMSLVTQAPGASGNTTTFTSGAASNVNGTSVSPTSPDYSSSANQVQQYQVGQSIPAGTFSVVSLVQHAQTSISLSGPQHFEFSVRTGGTNYFTSDLAPSTGWTLLSNNWDQNPATSAAWATSDLPASSASFNFGYKSTA